MCLSAGFQPCVVSDRSLWERLRGAGFYPKFGQRPEKKTFIDGCSVANISSMCQTLPGKFKRAEVDFSQKRRKT